MSGAVWRTRLLYPFVMLIDYSRYADMFTKQHCCSIVGQYPLQVLLLSD